MCGFWFFKTPVGTGAYNRERKSTPIRQAVTEKAKFWDLRLRIPFGNRLDMQGASLPRGTKSEDMIPEYAILAWDRNPWMGSGSVRWIHGGRVESGDTRKDSVWIGSFRSRIQSEYRVIRTALRGGRKTRTA